MKATIAMLLSFSTLLAFGQGKKEQIENLQIQLKQLHVQSILNEDSLRQDIKRLEKNIINIKNEKVSLEKKQISCVAQLNKIQQENSSYIAQLIKIQEENDSYTVQLNKIQQELKSKNDSIKQLQLEIKFLTSENLIKVTSESTSAPRKADFLNNYVVNRQPLNNYTFSFQLAKIITYNGEIPSIMDIDNFYLHYIPKGKDIRVETKESLVSKKPSSFLDSLMPQIEVLKNKLVTLKYTNGVEESFLYNLKSKKNTLNQQMSITLASETITNESNDIVWAICEINDESYIHLSYSQLERLMVPIDREGEYVHYKWIGTDYSAESLHVSRLPYKSGRERYYIELTKESIWLNQKKNTWVDVDKDIDAYECTYLFKLVEN
jgi:hypothetical protein